MTHDDARLLLSAVSDGEAARTPDLDAHLAGCADCAAYAAGLERVSRLAAALARPAAPPALAARVERRIGRRRRLAFRLAPALAAATAAAVFATTLTGAPGLPLPPAAAAEPLLELRALYVERTVTDPAAVTTERIWWRAPASLRVERTVVPTGRPGRTSLLIRGPGFRHEDGRTTTGVAPANDLPEPLSPTVPLLGADEGPGPVVAGLPTRRYLLQVGDASRVAYVADGLTVGGRDHVVVAKKAPRAGIVKTASRIDVNPDLPDSLFAPPGPPDSDGMFRERPIGELGIAPLRRPDGTTVVSAGAGPGGEAYLLARGSLLVLVRTGFRAASPETRTVVRDGVTYTVGVELYEPPAVEVTTPGGATVTVSAPLPPESLVELAASMYERE